MHCASEVRLAGIRIKIPQSKAEGSLSTVWSPLRWCDRSRKACLIEEWLDLHARGSQVLACAAPLRDRSLTTQAGANLEYIGISY